VSDSSAATSTASSATATVTFSKPPPLPAALTKENVKTQSKESIKITKETSTKPPTPKFTAPSVSKPSTNTAISDHFTNASNNKSNDIKFLMQVKDKTFNANKKYHDETNSTTTETTETTLTNHNDHEMQEEIESLKRELETVKARCETLSRDKSDILLRRLASMDTGTNRTAASEALKLQQRCNELKQEVEELRDDKKYLTVKVKELQQDLNVRPTKSIEEQLRAKLEQAETLCEELMDENEEVKKELRNMESEIDEMQDNYREDQADEYSKVKKELEQTTKNCRILSFKLKKSDRKIEQLEGEKQSLGGGQSNMDLAKKVKQLEDDLRLANEVARRLQVRLILIACAILQILFFSG
jgi:chromosome segregation ATPase